MDDQGAAERAERERIERLYGSDTETARQRAERIYGVGPETDVERAARTSAPVAQRQPDPPVPSSSQWHLATLKDVQLGWYPVFELAFKFTVALAVINTPIVIILYLLTR